MCLEPDEYVLAEKEELLKLYKQGRMKIYFLEGVMPVPGLKRRDGTFDGAIPLHTDKSDDNGNLPETEVIDLERFFNTQIREYTLCFRCDEEAECEMYYDGENKTINIEDSADVGKCVYYNKCVLSNFKLREKRAYNKMFKRLEQERENDIEVIEDGFASLFA